MMYIIDFMVVISDVGSEAKELFLKKVKNPKQLISPHLFVFIFVLKTPCGPSVELAHHCSSDEQPQNDSLRIIENFFQNFGENLIFSGPPTS